MKTISLFLFGLALACGGGSTTNDFAYEETKSIASDYDLVNSLETPIQEIEVAETILETEQKIIKTALLRFEASNPEETHKNIMAIAKEYQAFIQSDNAGKSYNQLYLNMVIRAPTQNFQALIDKISKGVPYFDQKDISRKDVTEEFVDLDARLKAKRELESRYLELLKKASSMKDMLDIERELSNIREEIEAKQGRLNYLQNKVSFSTISIEFYKQTAETGITLSYGQKMINAFKGGWDGISVFFIGLLYLWPLFILGLIVTLLLRWFIRKNRNKTS